MFIKENPKDKSFVIAQSIHVLKHIKKKSFHKKEDSLEHLNKQIMGRVYL